MLKIGIYLISLLFLSSQKFEIMELAWRNGEPGSDCIQMIVWLDPEGTQWNPEDKKPAGSMSVGRSTFTNPFLQKKTGLSLMRQVPIEEAKPIGESAEVVDVTIDFFDGMQAKFEGTIYIIDWDNPLVDQKVNIQLSKYVMRDLLEQAQDVHVEVRSQTGSYEQLIPKEAIKAFSKFHDECLD